jgi:uncharacterized protein
LRLTGIVIGLLLVCGLCSPASAAAPKMYSGPIIDSHAHIRLGDDDGASGINHPVGTDALRKLDDNAGVVQSALIVMARKGQLERTRTQNDAVMAAASASGGRFYPIISVHPADGAAALAELERVAKLGAREVKLHPNTQNFDVSDPEVAVVVEKCGDLGLVVLFDSYKPWDASEMGKFLLLSVQHPKTKLILAHMGFSQFREAVSFELVRRLGMAENVWFDLSAIANTYVDSPVQAELVWTMRKVGTERILFGSDWPVYTPAETARAVRHLGFTYAEQKQIFHDNAARLLQLDTGGTRGNTASVPDSLLGIWHRQWIERAGVRSNPREVEYLQTPAVFGDLRIPVDRPQFSHAASFADLSDGDLKLLTAQQAIAGRTRVEGAVATWDHAISFQPEDGSTDAGRLELSKDQTVYEHGLDGSYTEAWKVTPAKRFLAIQIARSGRPDRLLVVAGDRFLYVRNRRTDLPTADSLEALIASTHAGRAQIIEYLDCEFSTGMVPKGRAAWIIQRSTLPWRESARLELVAQLRPADFADGMVRHSTSAEQWTMPVNSFSSSEIQALFSASPTRNPN